MNLQRASLPRLKGPASLCSASVVARALHVYHSCSLSTLLYSLMHPSASTFIQANACPFWRSPTSTLEMAISADSGPAPEVNLFVHSNFREAFGSRPWSARCLDAWGRLLCKLSCTCRFDLPPSQRDNSLGAPHHCLLSFAYVL